MADDLHTKWLMIYLHFLHLSIGFHGSFLAVSPRTSAWSSSFRADRQTRGEWVEAFNGNKTVVHLQNQL